MARKTTEKAMSRKGTAMENCIVTAHAMITMPDIDMEEVQFGQLLVVLVALSVAVVSRLAAFVF